MKVASLLIFIAAISFIESSVRGFTDKTCTQFFDKDDEDHQAFSKDFCRSLEQDKDHKCCYIKYEYNGKTLFNCIELTLNDFYNVKNIKDNGANKGWDVKSIVCDSSSYLYGSLFLLLIFLF